MKNEKFYGGIKTDKNPKERGYFINSWFLALK